MDALRGTAVWTWLSPIIDWDSELARDPSSMIMPLTTSSRRARVAVRQVLGISFPSLCLMLQASHNAKDIEEAWLRMPLVRCGKAARGTSAGRQRPMASR